jgi:hypothetical protein
VQKIGTFCGTRAGFPCGRGLACVDPLGDGCDNTCGARDCGGICLLDLSLSPSDEEPPICDCGLDEVCVDDPSDDCFGCDCPTICRSSSPIDCSGRDTECPPGLLCTENPSCGSDVCGSTCIAYAGRECGNTAGKECAFGQICLFQDCDPVSGADCGGLCVQNIGAFCGGLAGLPCGRGLSCVDPLGDGCDIACSGRDCGGICLPDPTLVPPDEEEPPFCDCDPDEVCVDDPSDDCFGCDCPTICRSASLIECGDSTECPTDLFCIENPLNVIRNTCVAVEREQRTCGDIAGLECPFDQTCIFRGCDPASAADCSGVCVQKIGAFCGGIAGFPCVPGLACVDPLGDDCDNACGGRDCGGICLPDPRLGPQ